LEEFGLLLYGEDWYFLFRNGKIVDKISLFLWYYDIGDIEDKEYNTSFL
jgi:hypothetical protein